MGEIKEHSHVQTSVLLEARTVLFGSEGEEHDHGKCDKAEASGGIPEKARISRV